MRDDVLEAARRLAAESAGEPVDGVDAVHTLSGTWIARGTSVVVKVHPPGADGRALAARLRLAADPVLRECVLTPLRPDPVRLGEPGANGAWATVWPRVEPLALDVASAPWDAAGALLARLHRARVPARPAPPQGSVDRLRAALARLDAVVAAGRVPESLEAAVAVVRAAAESLPTACWDPVGEPGRPRTLVHGDWHLGQLGRLGDVLGGGPDDGWRLIDVDDLGLGDPAWDLARPAAFWAAGLMPDADWGAFVAGYRSTGGPAVPVAPADPWPAIDAPARASLVLAAAGAVRRAALHGAPLEEMDERLVEICARLPLG